ncbi:PIN domain-containing protein [Halorarius halobius]|uniref:PIN domain-containing protein n=1 Tax=Halorarius halobius TaxID=2962671 RepID=UPI0020CD71AD|nr:DUF188 domain-containing protein [Halorarius halobius]
MRVAVDTNALMMPVESGVRLFEELDRLLDDYEAVVPESVVAELDRLSEGNGEEATAASVGRDLVERCTVVSTDADFADDAIVELAADCDYVVTNDRPLRRRLRKRDVSTICLRGRSKLAVTN